MADSYKVGEAPWETGAAVKAPKESYKVGEAPWETPAPSSQQPGFLEKAGNALKDYGKAKWEDLKDDLARTHAIVEGGFNAATLNTLPVAEGAIKAGYHAGVNAIQGNVPSLDDTLKDYTKERDAAQDYQKEIQHNYPYAYMGGQVAGTFFSPIAKLAPLKAAPVEGAIAEYLPQFFSKVAKPAASAVAGAGNAGLAGALITPDTKKDQIDPLNLDQRLDNAKTGAVWGGGIGAVLGAGAQYGKQVLSTVFGPSVGGIDKYVEGHNRINSAPNMPAIKDIVDNQVNALREAVANGQLSVKDAQAQIDKIDSKIQKLKQGAHFEYTADQVQLRQNLEDARRELGGQKDALAKNLEVPHPLTMADDVHQAVGTLKDQVVGESKNARNILATSGASIQTQPVLTAIDDAINSHLIAGKEPVTASGQATVARLRQLQESLKAYPGTLQGEEAKNLIQQLDEEASYLRDNGGFSDSYSKAIKDARRAVDGQLKNNPAYRDQMQVVADKTALLDQANKLFGDPKKAYSAMNSIASPARAPQREVLSKLGQHVGSDFSTPIDKYIAAQDTLKNGMAPLEASLPGTQDVKNLKFINDVAPHLKDNYVQQVVNESGLPQEMSSQQAELQRIQQELQASKNKAAPFSTWTNQSSQNKLHSLITAPADRASIEAERELQQLDAMAPNEPSLLQSIDDNRVLNEFSRQYPAGSRNVVLGREGGDAIGSGTGSEGFRSLFRFLGALQGGYIDKAGGKMAKGILDHYIKHQSMYQNAVQKPPAQQLVTPWLMMK